MKVETKKEGDVVIFSLHGSVEILDYSDFASNINKFFEEESSKKVVLDCTKLSYVSSTGLRVFMTAYKKALENGVLMVVCGLQDTVNYVFDVTGFKDVLNVCHDKQDAMQFLED